MVPSGMHLAQVRSELGRASSPLELSNLSTRMECGLGLVHPQGLGLGVGWALLGFSFLQPELELGAVQARPGYHTHWQNLK